MADCLRVSLFPKRNRRWRWTGLWADWLTDWLGLVAAEDNAIGSFSVDDLWDRPNDEEVEGNGSDFLGLGLLICVSKVHWTRPKVSEPAMVPSLNRCLSSLAWNFSAWTPIDVMLSICQCLFFLQSLQNAWLAQDGTGLTQLLNWSISIHLGLKTQPWGIFAQLSGSLEQIIQV